MSPSVREYGFYLIIISLLLQDLEKSLDVFNIILVRQQAQVEVIIFYDVS